MTSRSQSTTSLRARRPLPAFRLANAFHFNIGDAILRACVDLRVHGVEHVRSLPAGTGFVLAANHVSHFDPALLSSAAERWIDWLAMVELYRGAVARAFWNALAAIPVDRARPIDRAAASAALSRLQAGRVVGIFPERGIRTGERSVLAAPDIADAAERLDSGACRLALGARVPVVPAMIRGSEQLYSRRIWLLPRQAATVTVRFGQPLFPDATEGYGKRAAGALHRRLAESLLELNSQT